MRPIKLTMTAFGAYAKTTVLEFDKLGTQGLYLITGDTGSGKTTIFDAISYALFGEPSGEFREPPMFRSLYADEKTSTVAELDFEYRGKKYRINRTMKSGGKKSVRLEFPNGKLFEKTTDVKREIEELLGINQNQFRQIVMLAQGDFRRMLFSDTENRRKIFRKIFNTEIYERFEDRIKEKSKAAKNSLNSAKEEALLRISGVKCDETGGLSEARLAINGSGLANLSTLEEFCSMLKPQNDEDSRQIGLLGERKDEIHKNWSDLSEEIVKEKENRKLFEDLKKLRSSIPSLEKLAEEDTAAADAAEAEALPELDAVKKRITLIESTLGEYEKLEENLSVLNGLKRRLERENAERGKLIEQRSGLSEGLDILKKESTALKNTGTELANLNSEKTAALQRKTDVSALLKDISELEKKREIRAQALENYRKAREKSEKAAENARLLRRSFNDGQAGLIAETLVEGSPCPVCGSVSHPNKAVKPQNAPSQAAVEKAEKLAETAAAAEKSASVESGEAAGAYSESENAVRGLIERLELSCGLENAAEAAETELKKTEEALLDIEKRLHAALENDKRRRELEESVPEYAARLDELNARFNELEKQIAADKTAIVEKDKQTTEQKSRLPFESRSAALSEADRLKASAELLQRKIKAAKEKAAQSAKALDGAHTEADAVAKRLPQGYVPVDLDEKNAKLYALDLEEKELSRKSKEIEFRLGTNAEILKALLGSVPKLRKLEEEYAVFEELSGVANGKSKFETFVQTEYLCDILCNANVHFLKMSNGQYELVRKEEPDDKIKDHTLDLDVKDHFNATVRDVKSLSGGESFIASLALALGLSETVQQNAGGVRLETMFVDEGFGSLDDETLQQAMKALTNLAGSDRLIGIISHVDAVKRDISKKIVVKKDRAGGSSAEIIV